MGGSRKQRGVMAVVTVVVTFLGGLGALFLAGVHLAFRVPARLETGSPDALGLPFREVPIPTRRQRRLFAWWIPAGPGAPTVIILHGWGANAEDMLPLAVPFHRAGYNLLLLDARGHGRSDRDTFASLPRFAEDVGAAMDWVREQADHRAEGIVLLGHSVGAGAVLLEASRRREVAAVISISAFGHPEWMMRRYLRRSHLPRPLHGLVQTYVQWLIGHRFGDIAPCSTIRLVDCPVLLVHGEEDATVPITDAEGLAAVSGAELLRIAGAGHDSVEKAEAHGGELIDFLQRVGVTVRARPDGAP